MSYVVPAVTWRVCNRLNRPTWESDGVLYAISRNEMRKLRYTKYRVPLQIEPGRAGAQREVGARQATFQRNPNVLLAAEDQTSSESNRGSSLFFRRAHSAIKDMGHYEPQGSDETLGRFWGKLVGGGRDLGSKPMNFSCTLSSTAARFSGEGTGTLELALACSIGGDGGRGG